MKINRFTVSFSVLGVLLLLFILLPLFASILSTDPRVLWSSLLDEETNRSIGLTFSASAAATIATIFFGVPLAYLLARVKFRHKRLVESIIDLPVVLPHTAAGIALLLVFGSKGVLGKGFAGIGVNFTDTFAGITVAMAFISLPYLVNLSRVAFEGVDPEMELAAQVDGASPWKAFFLVTLPQAWRGVLGGILMMWARGISEFGAVVILAYHPKILPVLIFERFQGFGLSAAKPVAVIMIVVVFLIFVLLRTLLLPDQDD